MHRFMVRLPWEIYKLIDGQYWRWAERAESPQVIWGWGSSHKMNETSPWMVLANTTEICETPIHPMGS